MIEINKNYNENCLDTMIRMPDNFIDLTITSPPYNMRNRVRNGRYTTREKSEHFSKKYKYFEDALPIEDFYIFHKKVIVELLRVSKIICYNFQIVTGSKEAFFKIIGDFSKEIKDIIVWDKKNGQPAMHGQVLNSCYELILVMENDNRKGRLISNAQFERGKMDNILRVKNNKNIYSINSAVFPDDLVYKLINNFSKAGGLIYDPFMGLGTVAKIAILNNRNWIGSEISKEYCEIIEKRIKFVNFKF